VRVDALFFDTAADLRAWFEANHDSAPKLSVGCWKKGSAYYRRAATHWVISAKRPETPERRLAQLIADSGAARRVPPLAPR